MAYSTVLFERIRECLPSTHYPIKRMFGGVAFFCRGHMLVGVFGDGMMVRTFPSEGDALLETSGIRPLASQPNRMRGFVVVDELLLDSDEAIADWIEQALVYNRTLPAK
jgi:TfoX/Sxy family transcriptional regulator of competence genes